MNTFIGKEHPRDGQHWEVQCARCGSSMIGESCGRCGGDGVTAPGELHEQDPLWYDPDDYENCHECDGEGGWLQCCSSPEYCKAHPIPGREGIARHMREWFVVERKQA